MGEYIDAIAIIAIVITNGFLGFFQERKAEKSLQALKELSAPQATVLRDGEWIKIPSKEIVPGDILKFSSGDRIGADVRIIESKSLEIEESALTGESVPVAKHSDRFTSRTSRNWRYGKHRLYGNNGDKGKWYRSCYCDGMKTAMGQIADLTAKCRHGLNPTAAPFRAIRKNINRCRVVVNGSCCCGWCYSRA